MSIIKIKKSISLYSKVTILFQEKMIKGTVIRIDLNGIEIVEDKQNHYKWQYVQSVDVM